MVTKPTNIAVPFADSGTKNAIPVNPTGDNHASFVGGFPPITMLPVVQGGLPPYGADFNGIFYDLSAHTVWTNAGGQYTFDASLASAIGGYPKGAVLQSNDCMSAYVSAVDGNSADFNTTPSSIGTLWLPYSGAEYPLPLQTVNFTATAGRIYRIDPQTCSSVTFPASASSGQWIELRDPLRKWWQFNTTIASNKFNGVTQTFVCDTPGESLLFTWIDNGTGWEPRVIGGI
jgi:hypothetical protein